MMTYPERIKAIRILKNFTLDKNKMFYVYYRKKNQSKEDNFAFHDVDWNERDNVFIFRSFEAYGDYMDTSKVMDEVELEETEILDVKDMLDIYDYTDF